MLFPTHIIIAIPIVYIFDFSTSTIIIGCILPDLIDKQLPKFNLTDNFHTIAHSLISIIPFTLLSYVYPILYGLIIGWLSHIILDIIHIVLNKRYKHILFIFWPVKYDPDPLRLPPIKFFKHYIGTRSFYFEFILWFICLYIFYVDFL